MGFGLSKDNAAKCQITVMTARALSSEKSSPSLTLPRQTAKNRAPVTPLPLTSLSAMDTHTLTLSLTDQKYNCLKITH